MRSRRSHWYFTYPANRTYWTWKPRNRINQFFLDHVGMFQFIPARNLQRQDVDPAKRITTRQVPPPFRRVQLPPGVTCLGTIVSVQESGYQVVYEVPSDSPYAHSLALRWAFEDAGFPPVTRRNIHTNINELGMPGQQDQKLSVSLHGHNNHHYVSVYVWNDGTPPDYEAEFTLPPQFTPPSGTHWLTAEMAYESIVLWPREAPATQLLTHWQAEAQAQGWAVQNLVAEWGGMLKLEKDGVTMHLTLKRRHDFAWLVTLPGPEHNESAKLQRRLLQTEFDALKSLAAER